MNLDDVKIKLKKKNKILFSRESECLQGLLKLIRKQKHRTLVLWAFECIQESIDIINSHYPDDHRVDKAVELCKKWAKGEVKMAEAKKALLEVHAITKEITDLSDIALCHAIGQALACIHVETHAIGLPIYELTAVVRKYGIDDCYEKIINKIEYYQNTLEQCEEKIDYLECKWAPFLLNDSVNKEQLLYVKKKKGEMYE